jgi:nephron
VFFLFAIQYIDVPEFTPPPSSTAVGVEGESLNVAMKATGNPMSIAYTWTKDGRPILAQNGNILFIYIYLF